MQRATRRHVIQLVIIVVVVGGLRRSLAVRLSTSSFANPRALRWPCAIFLIAGSPGRRSFEPLSLRARSSYRVQPRTWSWARNSYCRSRLDCTSLA